MTTTMARKLTTPAEIMRGDHVTYCGETVYVSRVEFDEVAGLYMVYPMRGGYPRSMAPDRAVVIEREVEQVQSPRARATTYYGVVVEDLWTGMGHFINDWGETFCGTTREMGVTRRHGRAKCLTCQRAGDAALRDGTELAGGSPARR